MQTEGEIEGVKVHGLRLKPVRFHASHPSCGIAISRKPNGRFFWKMSVMNFINKERKPPHRAAIAASARGFFLYSFSI